MKQMKVDIKGCARCGKDHDDLPMIPLFNPIDEYKYFTNCPENNHPILIKTVDSKFNADRAEIQSIHLSGNGQILAVDFNGHQIPELQDCNLILFWVKWAAAKGYDLNMKRIVTSSNSFRISKIAGNESEIEYYLEAEV